VYTAPIGAFAFRFIFRAAVAVVDENVLMESLQESVGDDYDVLGFLGKRDGRHFVFLARERQGAGELVAVQLEEDGVDADGQPTFSIDVVRQLDRSVPDEGALCPKCKHRLRKWARFCTQCGADVSGVGVSGGSAHSRTTLLSAVRSAASADLEILGEMPRAEGGGLVYFGREHSSGRIVALRLDQEGGEEYSLSVTRVIKPLPKRPPASSGSGTRSVSIVRRFTTEEREIIEEAKRRRNAAPTPAPSASPARSAPTPPLAPQDRAIRPTPTPAPIPNTPRPQPPAEPPRLAPGGGGPNRAVLIGAGLVVLGGAVALALFG
jgi:hypothetical protein